MGSNLLTLKYLGTIVDCLGALMLNRGRSIIVVAVAAAIIFMSAAPLADQPETAFNEIDTPINQTTPVSLWTKLFSPPHVLIVGLRPFGWTIEGKNSAANPSSFAVSLHLNPLREFLCSFLI
jgi:hypothetical protein